MFLPHCSSILIFLLCALLAPVALSMPEDRTQAIIINADQALRDEKQGLTVYSGNVQLDQGTLHISADRITIYRIVEDGDKIVAEGKPARMQQIPNAGEELMHANAGIIEYYKAEERVLLKQDAEIEQGGSIVTGQTIEYFISEQLVKAKSDEAQVDNRVHVVIPPNPVKDEPLSDSEKIEAASGNTDSE
jgi:lipopolysaccharide export system protein LptA